MHIAIFVDFHDSSVGGVQTSVRGQREGLERLGHTVTIVSPPPARPVAPDPNNIIIVPAIPLVRPNGFLLAAPSRHNRKIIEHALDKISPVDVIHAQTNMGIGLIGMCIARDRSIPLVQTMHGRDDVFAQNNYPLPYISTHVLNIIHSRYVKHTTIVPQLHDNAVAHQAWQIMVNHAQQADQVVVPSHHFLDKFRAHGVTKPIEVVSNGISDEVVAGLSHSKRLTIQADAPLHIMWCGRLSPEKRPIDSIKAVASLPGCQLDMYGNGPLAKDIEEYIDAHNLSARIHLKGAVKQSEVLAAMQQHDVLLYPSYGFDNQPMVLLEAVAAGIPVVYCDPDLTECMPAGGGLLTDDTSIESLKAALLKLQSTPAKRQAMHTAMYNYRSEIVQSYHSKKMVKLYKRLAKQK